MMNKWLETHDYLRQKQANDGHQYPPPPYGQAPYISNVSFWAPGTAAATPMPDFVPQVAPPPPQFQSYQPPSFGAADVMDIYKARRRMTPFGLGGGLGYGGAGSEDATAGGTFNSGAW